MSATFSSLHRGADSNADVLLEKLEDPRIVEALVSLLDKSDKLAFFAELLEGFLQRSEGLLESASQSVGQLGRAGTTALKKSLENVDLDDLKSASGQLQGMLPLLRDFATELGALKEAGFFDVEVVRIIGRAGRAMAATARDPKALSSETRGIFSLLGLLKDPDIARSLNFVISFARHFGGDLDHDGSGSAESTALAATLKSSARKQIS
jgi:uncharacterized protein YjgD (DUF1641 family)